MDVGQPATRRVNVGAGHRYELDGQECDGVTSIIRDGIAKPALMYWAATAAASYALDHWAELGELGSAARLRKIEKAPWAERDRAALRGTAVHDAAHKLALGAEVDLDPENARVVDSYLRFVDEWHVVDELVEAVVINRKWHYMGTLDLVATIGAGERWLLDFKTGASGVWPEAALQLSAYAHAETYLDGNVERAFTRPDRAGVVWLRADGYDLYPVPRALDAATFQTFLYAQQTAKFVRGSDVRKYPHQWIEQALRAQGDPRLEVVS
jgi:hypothetical protein